MNGYTKLFSTLVTSTIWQEPNDCRVLWITMLALKDEHNICPATVPALAKLANLSIKKCEQYLAQFQEPDRFSRSQEFEGRRIAPCEGGWLILNGEKYRNLLRNQERRDYVREKVAEHRARVNKCKQSKRSKPIADTDTKAEAEAKEGESKDSRSRTRDLDADFGAFWIRYPKKVGKQDAWKAWQKAALPSFPVLMNGLDRSISSDQWTRDGGRYIPHPATWLRHEQWTDEPLAPVQASTTRPLTGAAATMQNARNIVDKWRAQGRIA